MEKKIVPDKPFEPHVNRELCMRMTYNKYTRRYDLHNDDKLILSDHCRPYALFRIMPLSHGGSGVVRYGLPEFRLEAQVLAEEAAKEAAITPQDAGIDITKRLEALEDSPSKETHDQSTALAAG